MREKQGYNLDEISFEDSCLLVARMLKMVKDKDNLFTCMNDHIKFSIPRFY